MNVPRESRFKWDKQKQDAAILLAQGYLIKETAAAVGKSTKTIDRWKQDDNFSAEIDRLSLMMGIASRAERLRIAKRVVRQKTQGELILTDKDLLDWMKYAQSETDGVKLDLTSILDHEAPVAGGGSDGIREKAKPAGKPAKSAARATASSKTA
jgi:hypothetical protein